MNLGENGTEMTPGELECALQNEHEAGPKSGDDSHRPPRVLPRGVSSPGLQWKSIKSGVLGVHIEEFSAVY